MQSQLNVKDPDASKDEGKKRRRQQRMRRLDINSVTDAMDMNLSKSQTYWRTEEPGVLWSMKTQRVRHHLPTEQQVE